MAKNRQHHILSRIVGRRRGEEPIAVFFFIYFFLITLAIYIVKPVKESLFLENLGEGKLPHVFLLTAILMALAVSINSRLLQRMKRPLYISLSLGFFVASSLVFWLFLERPSPRPAVFFFFWSWADVFLVTSITQFWILINDVFPPREAKRRVAFFVSGGLLGGIAGSIVARFLSAIWGTENLILTCPPILIFCILIILTVLPLVQPEIKEEAKAKPGERKEKVGFMQSFLAFKGNRYVLLLCGMIVVAIIVSNIIDVQFKTVAKMAYPDKNALTSFFGSFYLGILIVSYFFTVLLTSRILKNLGFRIALLVLPLLLLVGSLSLFLLPAAAASLIVWGILIKGTDKSLSHSLTQSVKELLFIPIPQEVKYRAKVFIGMFLHRFADGLVGLLLIGLSSFIQLRPRSLGLLAIAFIFLWIAVVFLIAKEYVSIVKKNLKIKWQDGDKLVAEKIDVDMTKLVFDTLQSRDRSSVLYAMNLFDLIKKDKLSPELKTLLSLKSDEIRARSMDALMDVDGESLLPELDDSLEPEVLNAEVREIVALDVYQELMKERLEKAIEGKGKDAEVSRMEAAKAMGLMDPKSPLILNLKKLLKDVSPEVVRYAAESAGKLKKRELVPLLINHLSRSATHEAASQALIAYGEMIIGTLKDFLDDPEEDIRTRKAIPSILARTGSQRAADILALELRKDNAEVEAEIIEALPKMRAGNPKIRFPEKIIFSKVVDLVRRCYLTIIQIHDLRVGRKKEIQVKDAENNLARSVRHIFELLGLVYPQEDIIRAYQNISAGTKKALDYSVELLDNILKKEIKEILLPLIEDTPFEEKARISRKMLKAAEKIDFS